MEKYYITRYQKLQHFNAAWKGVIHCYSKNIKASITILQNKSSSVIKFTIHRSYKIITSSNYSNVCEISAFSSASNIKTERNSRSIPNGSIIFGISGKFKDQFPPMGPVLLLSQLVLLFQKASSLILTKNQDSIR